MPTNNKTIKTYAILLKLDPKISNSELEVWTKLKLRKFIAASLSVECIYCEETDKAHPQIMRKIMSEADKQHNYILTFVDLTPAESKNSRLIKKKLFEMKDFPLPVISSEYREKYRLHMMSHF